jgi:hypothetical protein
VKCLVAEAECDTVETALLDGSLEEVIGPGEEVFLGLPSTRQVPPTRQAPATKPRDLNSQTSSSSESAAHSKHPKLAVGHEHGRGGISSSEAATRQRPMRT